MAYVFYDTETTGLNRRFDQITQFAAVFTDENFVVKDQINLRCKIRPEIIPSIEALIKTNKSISELTDKRLPTNYEMMSAVKEALEAWSPALFVGWNTIRFDEEFLRSGFNQNLLPTYLTNINGNSRLDFLKLAHAAHLLEPGSIDVPTTENGKQTFSLEPLALANGFSNFEAHDALADVHATIHIAKLLKKNARTIWSLGNRFSNKKATMAFLEEKLPAIAFEPNYEKTHHYPFIKIGNHPEISAYAYVADLRCNLDSIETTDPNEEHNWLNSVSRSVNILRCNSSPIIVPFDEIDQFEDYDLDALRSAACDIVVNQPLMVSVSEAYFQATHREYSNKFIEEQIYEANLKEDQLLKQHFHKTDWANRVSFLEQFEHQRSRRFALRLLGEHSKASLSASQVSLMDKFLAARRSGLSDQDVPWRTVKKAQKELQELGEIPDDRKQQIVAEYKIYISTLEKLGLQSDIER